MYNYLYHKINTMRIRGMVALLTFSITTFPELVRHYHLLSNDFNFVVVYYTDDGSLELGSETFGLVTYHGNAQ